MERDAAFQTIAQRTQPDAALAGIVPLRGGISSPMTVLRLGAPGRQETRILVREMSPWALRGRPRTAAEELQLLRILTAAGLPVPTPLWCDESGDLLPAPFLVLGYIEGATQVRPASPGAFVDAMATMLARVHALDSAPLAFLPDITVDATARLEEPPAEPDLPLDEPRIRAALTAHWPPPAPARGVLLHGDFWTGNILWRDGAISGLIDWEDAHLGDPLADLAIARLDLCWLLGQAAARRFTRAYQAATGANLASLPIWDLYAALGPAGHVSAWAAVWPGLGRPEIDAAWLRRGQRAFVKDAIARLG